MVQISVDRHSQISPPPPAFAEACPGVACDLSTARRVSKQDQVTNHWSASIQWDETHWH